jgi:hypothetical protein
LGNMMMMMMMMMLSASEDQGHGADGNIAMA